MIVLVRRGRTAALLLAASIGLAACVNDGGSDDASSISDEPTDAPSATASEPEPTPTTSTSTTTTIAPGDPTENQPAIVALDEQTAIQLLTLGVEPSAVLTSLSSEVFAELNRDIGVETVDFIVAEPSFEVIAALDPDLLVGIANPFVVDRSDEYEALAPLVLAPLDATWQEQLEAIAIEVDATDEASAVIGAVDQLATETAAAVADARPDGITISLLTMRIDNILAITSGGATGRLLTDLGVDRPDPQRAEGPPGIPFVPVSEENLTDHDADIVMLAAGAVFDLTRLDGSPVFQQLDAVASGDVHEVVGDLWVLGGTGLAAVWVLEDLRSLLVDDVDPAALTDAADRWASFLGLFR